MLKSLRLRNLRSFSDDKNSPYIDLKPLTVLIGKNSSGKSSFLRSLPLLRQSVEVGTAGPILWYGNYIDFGAFSEAKSNASSTDTIFFDFKVVLPSLKVERFNFSPTSYSQNFRKNLSAEVQIGIKESSKKTVPSILKINIDSIEYIINFDEYNRCSLLINDVEEVGVENLAFNYVGGFLPNIFGYVFEKDSTAKRKSIPKFDHNYFDNYFSSKIKSKIKRFFHPSTAEKTIESGVSRLTIYERSEIKNELEKIFRDNSSFIRNLQIHEKEICDSLYELCMHKNVNALIRSINDELSAAFKSVRYIAPLRSTAERYYRYQDLQVNEMNHTGSNLAMILRSLSGPEKERFSKWTSEHFGFRITVEELGLHYALKIQTENDPLEYNINDMGFGFSQILPILVTIWVETTKKHRSGGLTRFQSRRFIFAIEQPELHLHPEYQSRLARLFAAVIGAAKDNDLDIVILFETHSKTMIDTLGDCISESLISEEEVNIVLFQKDMGKGLTDVKFSRFDDEGNLLNWPIGFFSGRA